ncbi:hypothetical protein PR048_005469 [Dryococelus australis]|uniref:Uncharacterized protein n=1 Tax=Dryococelus australis TaxID=614101 RepID=A0ABQ9I8A1_9NEOP|nr:hypothetical protein PR048_005469 [Dryococelus australis]
MPNKTKSIAHIFYDPISTPDAVAQAGELFFTMYQAPPSERDLNNHRYNSFVNSSTQWEVQSLHLIATFLLPSFQCLSAIPGDHISQICNTVRSPYAYISRQGGNQGRPEVLNVLPSPPKWTNTRLKGKLYYESTMLPDVQRERIVDTRLKGKLYYESTMLPDVQRERIEDTRLKGKLYYERNVKFETTPSLKKRSFASVACIRECACSCNVAPAGGTMFAWRTSEFKHTELHSVQVCRGQPGASDVRADVAHELGCIFSGAASGEESGAVSNEVRCGGVKPIIHLLPRRSRPYTIRASITLHWFDSVTLHLFAHRAALLSAHRSTINADLGSYIPLDIRQHMSIQHDGAPGHFAVIVRKYLRTKYGDYWIDRGGPVT